MQTYLMTRGLGRGYGFLGSAPAEPWWREFGQFTAFEQPTLLIHADNSGWRVYASAIPTTRRDRTNTLIRLSLALEYQRPAVKSPASSDGAVPDEFVSVLALVRSWLSEERTAAAPKEFAKLLDEEFPTHDTEQFISTAGPANDDEVNRRVRYVLNEWRKKPSRSAGSVDPALVKPDSWFGDVNDEEVRAAFLHRARALLLGDHSGWAVQLNLAGEAEIRSYFERQHEPLVALLDECVPGGPRELRPKAPTPPVHPRSRTASRTRVVMVVAVTVLLLIGLIVWLLTHSQPIAPSSPTQPSQSTIPGPLQPQPPQQILPSSSMSRYR